MSHKQWRTTLLNMTIVVAATIAAFFLFRWIAAQFFSRSNNWIVKQGQRDASSAHPDTDSGHTASAPSAPPHGERALQSGLYRKSVAIIGALIADIAAILLAGAAGYEIGRAHV